MSSEHPVRARRGRTSRRPISRRRRRRRLRATTFLPCRGTIVPNRGTCRGAGAMKTSRWEKRTRVPSLRRERISPPRRIRLARGSRSPRWGMRSAEGDPTGAYDFAPTLTESWLRPRLRRRASVLRPPRVFIRARNPCLFTRLRLRGLYVGFIRLPLSTRTTPYGTNDSEASYPNRGPRVKADGRFAPPDTGKTRQLTIAAMRRSVSAPDVHRCASSSPPLRDRDPAYGVHRV